jgi:uncharacterized membrane protein
MRFTALIVGVISGMAGMTIAMPVEIVQPLETRGVSDTTQHIHRLLQGQIADDMLDYGIGGKYS